MPRVYKRKSETPHVSENILKVAVAKVENGMSLREATYSAGISKSALHRCIKKSVNTQLLIFNQIINIL